MSDHKPIILQRGSILLLVLLMLLVFVIISAASLGFIARQSNQTVLQEQEEQAFEIADAGINYTLWLLSAAGGNQSPLSLVASPPPSTRDHAVTSQQGQTIGQFDLFFGPACPDSLDFRAVGYDQIKTNLCQVVDAKVKLFATGEYKLVKWDHLVGYPCNQSYVPPSPSVCSPLSSPGPAVSPSPSLPPTPTPSCDPALCPSGWQCGSLGTCEPNSCDDVNICTDDSTCPPDHERVSFCSGGFETFRDWECCESCNAGLQLLCGGVAGGYCTPTYYTEACETEEPTPTFTASCAISGGSCTISGDTQCCPGLGLSCVSGVCVNLPDTTTPPGATPTAPAPSAIPTAELCTPIVGACGFPGSMPCCAGLNCTTSGFCSPGGP